MDAAYAHLLVNHFPIVLSVVGALAALLSIFTRHRGTWTFALGALLLAALTVYPAVFSGERAEHVMEKAWYVDEKMLEAHEQAAKLALWGVLATGLFAIAGIWRERTAYTGGRAVLASPTWMRAFVAIAALASAGLLARTAWTAGFIVHKAERLQREPAAEAPLTGPSTFPQAQPAPADSGAPAGATTGVTTGAVPVIRPPGQ